MKKQKLLNTYVNNVTMHEVIRGIEYNIQNKIKSYVIAVNTDVIIQIENDAYLKEIVGNADIVIVDGQPLVWISKFYKTPVKGRVSGSDLIPALCKLSAKRNYSIFIIGGKPGVAEKARKNLEREIPQIKISGTYSPPFGFEKDKEELKYINEMISKVHPDIVVACFGCPKQEKWIYENYLKYDATVSICAGATVDFLAGEIKRAPKWMRRYGLEWLYRITQDPKRLIKRYLVDDIKIFRLIKKYRVKKC